MIEEIERTVLVTGASGEIGKAVAEELHEQGFIVCLSGTREKILQELASKLQTRVHVVTSDLASSGGTKKLFDKATGLMGRIDVLINNAGITRDNLLLRMSDQEWNDVLNINLTSAMSLTRLVLRPMMKSKWGRVVNITSVVGITGNPGQANYCASKAGIVGMSKSIAKEVASRGITVNCVAPGFIASAMTNKLNQAQKDTIINNIPMKKMGTAKDVAVTVSFLCSERSSYITGQTLHVNGGLAMV